MAKIYGAQFPERPLMSTISDLLGIPHFTTSRGSTVRTDFLRSMADAMNISVPDNALKDDVLQLVWEHANKTNMPADRLSRGGTVTNEVLQEIIDGILTNNIAGLTSTEPPAEQDSPASFEDDLASLGDDRTRALREAAIREGQSSFRAKVLTAYNSKCAVTGTDVPAALEAAHITPYKGPRSNVIRNGISLRRDIHSLFDRGLLAIHEESLKVLLDPIISASATYSGIEGVKITRPRDPAMRPDLTALKAHREWSGLES